MEPEVLTADMRRMLGIGLRSSLLAGDAVMQVYRSDFDVALKSDQSPITEADRRSHEILLAQLGGNLPVLSEEGSEIAFEERKDWGPFWLIDPLDGTKDFIKRNGEFTVNAALIEHHIPVAGIVYLPAKEVLYFGARGFGAYRVSGAALDKIRDSMSRDPLEPALAGAMPLPDPEKLQSSKKIRIVQSLSHVTEQEAEFAARLKEKFPDLDTVSAGSSLKFCRVAEGSADLYPRFGPTMEWDTAAGQCVAESSGCEVLDLQDFSSIRYNRPVLRNGSFMAIGTRLCLKSSWRESIIKLARQIRNVNRAERSS
jgi:3'(2'), 5'-bisphosphate nucleotidase